MPVRVRLRVPNMKDCGSQKIEKVTLNNKKLFKVTEEVMSYSKPKIQEILYYTRTQPIFDYNHEQLLTEIEKLRNEIRD